MSIISTGNDIDDDRLLNSFLLDDINGEDGPVLNQQMIQETQAEAGCDFGHKDNTIYTVVFSFWLFFSEMVFTGKDRSTTAAVVRANQMLQLMGEETYATMPEKLQLRLVEVIIDVPGWRTGKFYVVTTLLDTEKYTSDSIGDLYYKRWNIELDMNAIKTTMKMDRLRGKSPEMVRTELWMGLLVYNIVRSKMLNAARRKKINPRHISFATAYDVFSTNYCTAPLLDRPLYEKLRESVLDHLTDHLVGNRPGRCEPRLVKQRPKPHDMLMESRQEARQRLFDKTERIPTQEGPGKRKPKECVFPSIQAISTNTTP